MSDNLILAINKIRELDDSLSHAKITNAIIDKQSKSVTVRLISDKQTDNENLKKVEEIIKSFLPESFRNVTVNAVKTVADKELVKKQIENILKTYFMSVSHSVGSENIEVGEIGDNISYKLKLTRDTAEFFIKTNVTDRLDEMLSNCFCNSFNGFVEAVGEEEKVEYEIKTVDENSLTKNPIRFFKVLDVAKFIDENIYDTASYICDYNAMENFQGVCYFAGRVTAKQTKQSKKGNTYYSFDLNDTTGSVNLNYFTTAKDKISKIEKINIGSEIIVRCESELYNGRCSLFVKGINLCLFPKNFVPQEKPCKSVPNEYTFIKPLPVEDVKQGDIFTEQKPVPDCLIGKTFVVVDVETTGTDPFNDEITEIGAVKIVDGKLSQQFQTLVNPTVAIPEKIVKLTGIDDEMVKDKPLFTDIAGDFMKFLGDAVFVAHNADFDSKFVKRKCREADYKMDNKVLDTLAIARNTVFGISNYKLNTICEHFNIQFHHHRALSDAYATAEMFIELARIKPLLND